MFGKFRIIKKNNIHYNCIIADDHDIVRAGIKSLLRVSEQFHVEGEASSYTALTEVLHQKDQFDLLIVDLNMGDQNGLRAIRHISDHYPDMKILVVSMFPEEPYALYVLREGAHGYLNKERTVDELIPALEMITSNHKYVSPEYHEILLYGTDLSKQKESGLALLSQREFEVYSLILTGMSFKEIAQKLGLSSKTISAHHTNILHKLSLSNMTQLIHFGLKNMSAI